MVKIDISKLKQKIVPKLPAKLRSVVDKLNERPGLKRKITTGAIIFVLVISSFWLYEKIKWSGLIKVSGVIEGDDVRVSFRVEGQIHELLVDEGYYVEEGQLVARLVKDNLTEERDEAIAALERSEYQLELDKLNHVRAENLFKEGAISQLDRDTARTTAETSASTVENLRASLALSETRLGWGDLASPLNGYVILKSSLQGEVVQISEPVFTVVDLQDIWVTAYINERDLGKVKFGQKAFVKIDTYPFKKYKGWVSFISQQTEFTPKYIQTTTERVKYVYRIKVRVDNSSLDLKPGIPADAYIIIK